MKTVHYIFTLVVVAVLNVLVYAWPLRLDMTEDKRYSLHEPTKELLAKADKPIEIQLMLGGELNASFMQLKVAAEQMVEEMGQYANIHFTKLHEEEIAQLENSGLTATIIHEKQRGGQTMQTMIYPYAGIRYDGHETVVLLLTNTRGLSGEENINRSIEQLEFTLAEGLSQVMRSQARKVAFLTGHDELPDIYVYDAAHALSQYFEVSHATLTGDYHTLCEYDVLIIADPQKPFSEAERYQIDQYVMQGGHILWVMDGVRHSQELLATEGYTPIIAKEVGLQNELLFHYGVQFTPSLLLDRQCLTIPVEVSGDRENPNFQPMPWYFSPLLLPSQQSIITNQLGEVSSSFCSGLAFKGENDGLRKSILLATSSASTAIGTPNEVGLSLFNMTEKDFPLQYIPVAALVEGEFPSPFSYLGAPDSVVAGPKVKKSVATSQVFVASSSIITNEVQQEQPLPLGYDRYSGMQFSNRDFIINSILYMVGDSELISLRARQFTMHLLNEQRSHDMRSRVQVATISIPLLILFVFGILFITIRKRKYSR